MLSFTNTRSGAIFSVSIPVEALVKGDWLRDRAYDVRSATSFEFKTKGYISFSSSTIISTSSGRALGHVDQMSSWMKDMAFL